MEMDVKTIVGVNVRQGPAISFDVIDNIESNTVLHAIDYIKDASGIGWFKLDDKKWICSKFVTSKIEKSRTLREKTEGEGDSSDKKENWTQAKKEPKKQSTTDKILNEIKNSVIMGTATNINGGLFGSTLKQFTDGAISNDVILKKRLFGVPFQFIDTTDIRPTGGSDSELGIFFQNSIMAEAPVLSLLPGRPDYLANLTDEGKKDLTESLLSMVNSSTSAVGEAVKNMVNAKELDIKYFEFLPQHTQYMQYVDLLCRMGAIYMGLGNSPVPGTTTPYGKYNWKNYTLANVFANRSSVSFVTDAESVIDKTGTELKEFIRTTIDNDGNESQSVQELQKIVEPYNMEPYYIDFFITPSISFNESFSNSTTESMLSSAIGKASNFQKEFMFLLAASGYRSSSTLDDSDDLTEAWRAEAEKLIGSKGGSKLIERLVTGATSVISGSNIVFPEVWNDSNFDRGYQFEIKLSTPYGTRESIFLEILVPMFHLLALTLPCQSTVNSYSAPFVVRSVLPGFFSSEMGIVQDLTINKGGSGDSWTVDGFPTEVTINLTIKDLYNSMAMSKLSPDPLDIHNFIWNSGLVDYVGTQCGLNMKKSEYAKKIEVLKMFVENIYPDTVTNVQENVKEMVARNTIRIFGGK